MLEFTTHFFHAFIKYCLNAYYVPATSSIPGSIDTISTGKSVSSLLACLAQHTWVRKHSLALISVSIHIHISSFFPVMSHFEKISHTWCLALDWFNTSKKVPYKKDIFLKEKTTQRRRKRERDLASTSSLPK